MQTCLKFTNEHFQDLESDWEMMLWSHETKKELFGINSTLHVCRMRNADYDAMPKSSFLAPIVKHGGGNIMVFFCKGPLHHVNGRSHTIKSMNLQNDHGRVFQRDNHSKHTAQTTKFVCRRRISGSWRDPASLWISIQ